MANKAKGEVDLQVGDKVYVLRYSVNALCNLEDALGVPIFEYFSNLSKIPSFNDTRKIFWAGLSENNPRPTLEEAGEIVSTVGLTVANEHMMAALNLGMPKVKESTGDPEEKK